MILLSITGLFKTGLIILGVMFLLRAIGKVSQVRRNVADQDRMKREEANAKSTVDAAKKNYGKTTISKVDSKNISDNDYTDFEEISE
ncbi:MAG: hypothetical protein ACI857_002830 [Arenicella sp.]|jgi:hypothetical protein